MNIQKIVIIGGEGTSTNIAEAIIDSNKNYNSKIEFIGFANDTVNSINNINEFPIVTSISNINNFLTKYNDVKIIFSLYKPLLIKERAFILQNLSIDQKYFINFIHPSCFISPSVKLGIGNVFLNNSVIHNNVCINNFNIFNSNCVVEHNCIINSYNFFAAGSIIGSTVKIADFNFFGLNSSVKENLIIPESTFFGMGSVVVKAPNKSNEIWMGNPASKYSINDY